jgi:hypothetical protein
MSQFVQVTNALVINLANVTWVRRKHQVGRVDAQVEIIFTEEDGGFCLEDPSGHIFDTLLRIMKPETVECHKSVQQSLSAMG